MTTSDHDRQHQQRLVAHEGADEVDDLGGDLGDRDQPGRDQRGGDQEHDDAGAERGRDEDVVELADLQLAIDAGRDEQRVDGDDDGGFGRREYAEPQADDDDRRQHQRPEAVDEGPGDLAQRLARRAGDVLAARDPPPGKAEADAEHQAREDAGEEQF